MRANRRIFLAVLLGLALPALEDVQASWPTEFTDESSAEMAAVHERIYAMGLDGARGIPVQDVHWRDDYFDLYLESGAIFLEPDIEGYPVGAFFVGEGTVSFTPTERKARMDLYRWFGTEALGGKPITSAYFFTLKGQPLTAQLGLDAPPSAPFQAAEAYEESKRAMRQLGTVLLHAFLNRQGRSKGVSYVLFPLEEIRTSGSSEACLLYSHDRNRDD
ncbi:MAG: hypothetical protein V3U98_12030, partial [Acidobacteriota bacterium]